MFMVATDGGLQILGCYLLGKNATFQEGGTHNRLTPIPRGENGHS